MTAEELKLLASIDERLKRLETLDNRLRRIEDFFHIGQKVSVREADEMARVILLESARRKKSA